MKKMKIIAPIILLIAIVGVFVSPLGTLITYQLFDQYPKNDTKTLKLSGLKEKTTVIFDEFGVPHIEAQNTHDLVLATGFIHGRYRLFQLDVLRRFASGRVSELLGEQKILNSSTVMFDLAMRGWGFREKAKININDLPELDREIIQAFSSGVNQAMKKYPSIEHKLLGVTPEPWEYSDTLIVGLLQAWSITHNWEQEAVKFALVLNLGIDEAKKIYPHDPLYDYGTIDKENFEGILPPSVVPEMEQYLGTLDIKEKLTTSISIKSALGALMEMRPAASNAWVVGKSYSHNNMPILHNDMHLSHALPSLLFLQHLKMPGLDAIGGTMPGLPFLIGGYNGKVAWGATSAVADAIDLVVEKEDPDRKGYTLNELKDCPIENNEIEIKIKDAKAKKFPLRKTCNGTLFNDMYPTFLPKSAPMVAVRFQLPNVQLSFGHLMRANMANDVFELRSHLMNIPSPVQNIMAADSKGNIGFFPTGSVPKRLTYTGAFPIPGWLKKYEWIGWLKPDEMPHSFNPKKDYFVNANNLVHNPFKNFPVFHVDAAPEFRFNRIKDRIVNYKHSQKSLLEIQKDNVLYRAKKVAPIIIGDLKTKYDWNKKEKEAIDLLSNWDYSSHADSIGSTLFFSIYRQAILEALSTKLDKETQYVFLKQRYSTNIVDLWFEEIMHPAWDNKKTTDKRELRTGVIHESFKKAMAFLTNKLGSDISKWHWGKLHYVQPTHPFAKKSILSFMNLPKIPLAGGLDSVWKAHFNLNENGTPFKTVAGPVIRISIDMAKPEDAQYGIDTGQSGWPNSPHYGDQYRLWQKGELIPMERDWDQLKKKYASTILTLNP